MEKLHSEHSWGDPGEAADKRHKNSSESYPWVLCRRVYSQRGIVSLQIRNHPEIIPTLMKKLVKFLSANSAPEYYKGKTLIIEAHRIRIRGYGIASKVMYINRFGDRAGEDKKQD